MADRVYGPVDTDLELEAALRALGAALDVPPADRLADGALDPARRARLRIESAGGTGTAAGQRSRWTWLAPRPGRRVGRGFGLGLVAVAAIAAVAGAIGLGLPGIRIVPAPPSSPGPSASVATGTPRPASPAPSASRPGPSPTVALPLGIALRLGDRLALDGIAAAVDIPIGLPTGPGVGRPATAWLRDGRLTLVWATGPGLPSTGEPGVGLVLSEFRGSLEPGYFEKLLSQGTTIETIRIGDLTGYWISGAPHEIVYVDAHGDPVFDSRRSVGDTLLWARGDVTYRLETGLGRAAAVDLGATIP